MMRRPLRVPWLVFSFACWLLPCDLNAGPMRAASSPQWTSVTPFPPLASNDAARMVASTANGTIYVLGNLGAQLALVKLSADGDTLWTARYPGVHPVGLARQDSSAMVVIATNASYPFPSTAYLTLKYTADGVLAWERRHDVGRGSPAAVAVSLSGNICVSGASHDSTWNGDVVTIAYDPNGNELWTGRYDGPSHSSDEPRAMVYDSAGNVYITGTSYPAGGCTTLKYDPAGTLLWARNEPGLNGGAGIVLDASGGPTVVSNPDASGETSTSLVHYDSDGGSQWTAPIVGINPTGLVQDSQGNLYVATTLHGSDADWHVSKLGPLGDVVWEVAIQGPPGSRDLASSMTITADGALYVGGQWSDAAEHIMLARVAPGGWEDWKILYGGPGADCFLAPSRDGVCFVTSEWVVGGQLDWIVRDIAPLGSELWRRSFSGLRNPEAQATAVRLDHDGRPVIAGYAESAGGAGDVTAGAYDSNGSLRWSARSKGLGYLGTPPAVGIDAIGNIYVASSAQNATPDITLLKYDPVGTTLWSRYFDGPAGKDDYAEALAVNSLGNAYITGTSVADGDWNYDLATWKYSPTGALEWVRRFPSPACPLTNRQDRGFAIALAGDSDIVVTGVGNTGAAGCPVGIATIKYTPAGAMRWSALHAAPSGSVVRGAALAVDGTGIYVLGAATAGDGVLIKYDHEGHLAWSRAIAPSQPSASLQRGKLTIGADGSINLCATENHPLGSRYFVASYDANGAERWRSIQYDGSGEWNQPAAICNGPGGSVYVTGRRQDDFGTILFDHDGSVSWESRYDGGYGDNATDMTRGVEGVYVVGRIGLAAGSAHAMLKYLDPQLLGVDDSGRNDDPRVIVRGSGAVVRIEFDVRPRQEIRLELYDVQGRRIARAAGRYSSPGRQALEVDSRTWPAGIVFLRLASDDGTSFRKKIVLVR